MSRKGSEDDNTTSSAKKMTFSRSWSNMIICAIIGVLIIGTVGGIVAFVLSNNQGMI